MLHLMHFCSDMTEDTTTQFLKIVLFIYLANIKYLCHRRQFAHLQTEYTIFGNFLSDGVLTIHSKCNSTQSFILACVVVSCTCQPISIGTR